MSATTGTLYQEVVDVTTSYLGPAAERFITRQIKTHLNKEPSKLSKKDLLNLIDWIKISIALLTDDGRIVEEFINKLHELATE